MNTADVLKELDAISEAAAALSALIEKSAPEGTYKRVALASLSAAVSSAASAIAEKWITDKNEVV